MRLAIVPLVLLLGASTLAAQSQYPITTLVLEGDAVAGVGNVTRIDNIAVNDSGNWLAEVDTDNVDTDADGAVLENGVLYLREGQALAMPVGSTLDSFDSVYIDSFDDAVHNFFLDGTTGSGDDSGIYFNTTLMIQESDVSSATGFTAGTTYEGFFEVKPTDNFQAFVMASVDDPAIASSVDRALVQLDHDGAGGSVLETVIAKEGDVLPGQTEAVSDFDTGPHNFAVNNSSHLMYVADLTGATAFNTAVYIWDGSQHNLIAQKGTTASVSPTRDWSSLASSKVDLGASAGKKTDGRTFATRYVYTGSLTGDSTTNSIIVKNTAYGEAKLVQEGDSLSGMGGFSLTSFGSGPVYLGENGNVLFYGDWNDPDTSKDTGLFLNGQLIVQEGVTTIGGLTVTALRGIQDGYALSNSGRYIVFEAQLSDGNEGVFRIDTGAGWENLDGWLSPTPLAAVEPGAAITALGIGDLTPFSSLSLTLGNATPSTPATLVASPFLLEGSFKGGIMVPFPTLLLGLGTTSSDGALTFAGAWPPGLPSGATFYMQWWMPDADGPVGFVASNGFSATTP
ncbi:MAG: hypothetical protein ACYTCU_10960 [Planctomycetota bacterium]|jgi:hypothetical protein